MEFPKESLPQHFDMVLSLDSQLCEKIVTQVNHVPKFLTKFDLGEYPFLRGCEYLVENIIITGQLDDPMELCPWWRFNILQAPHICVSHNLIKVAMVVTK
jgi:hypothetical protein